MRSVRLDNLNEMRELKRLYGSEFIGVLNANKYYKIRDSKIISIEEDIASKLLKLNSLIELKLIVTAMYFETDQD